MAQVFISYSRQDKDFVLQLRDALQAAGRDVWLDLHDIPPSAKWQQEISDAIAGADAFVFVLSPDSLASPACKSEIEQALAARKRIIPIVAREVDPRQAPPEIASLNWIYFRPQDTRNEAMQKLRFALDTDLDFWHKGSDILVRARKWDANKKNPSFTLRGAELADAERWLSQSATKQPSPTPMQVDYITASRRAAARRQRTTIGLLSAGLIITLVLAVVASLFSVKLNIANNDIQAKNAVLQADVVAGQANVLRDNHQLDEALLASAYANSKNNDLITRSALWDTLNSSPYLERILDKGFGSSYSTYGSHAGIRTQYSADGKTLLVNSYQGIKLWDMTTLKVRKFFPVAINESYPNTALSPDGSYFITEDSFGALLKWDAVTGKNQSFGSVIPDADAATPHEMQFSPDGSLLALGACGAQDPKTLLCTASGVTLWDMQTLTKMGTLKLDYLAYNISLSFSADGKTLAVGLCSQASGLACGTSQISTWNVLGKKRISANTLPQTSGDLYDAALSPNGKILVTVGTANHCFLLTCRDGRITAYDGITLKQRTFYTEPDLLISHVAISSDNQHLVYDVGNANFYTSTISIGWRILSLVTGVRETIQPFTAFNTTGENSVDMAISPDNKHFVSLDTSSQLLYWRFTPYSTASIEPGNDFDSSSPVAYSPDDRELVTGTLDGRIVLWEASSGKKEDEFQDGLQIGTDITELAFLPGGKKLAVGDNTGTVRIIDLTTKHQVGQPMMMPNEGSAISIISIVFTADGKRMLVTDSYRHVVLWNTATGQQLVDVTKKLPLHGLTTSNFVTGISPDGRSISVGVEDNQSTDTNLALVLLDSQTLAVQAKLTNFQQVIDYTGFSPDGKLMITADDAGVYTIWNRSNLQPLAHFQVPVQFYKSTYLGSAIPVAQFNQDGTRLLASYDNGIIIWDVTHEVAYTSPELTLDHMIGTDISPDGQFIATALQNGPIAIQSLKPTDWQAQACDIVHRNLTHDEWNQIIGGTYQKVCPNLP